MSTTTLLLGALRSNPNYLETARGQEMLGRAVIENGGSVPSALASHVARLDALAPDVFVPAPVVVGRPSRERYGVEVRANRVMSLFRGVDVTHYNHDTLRPVVQINGRWFEDATAPLVPSGIRS